MQEQILGTSYAAILGQMIKQLREEHKPTLDQKDVAEQLGVSVMTVSRIESGDTVLDVPQMDKVAHLFKMDPVEFFKKSLEVKRRLEKEKYKVLEDKKEINKTPNFAAVSLVLVAGIVVGVLLSRK
jgi:transcriptional regulator with XRE-family HTH domain